MMTQDDAVLDGSLHLAAKSVREGYAGRAYAYLRTALGAANRTGRKDVAGKILAALLHVRRMRDAVIAVPDALDPDRPPVFEPVQDA